MTSWHVVVAHQAVVFHKPIIYWILYLIFINHWLIVSTWIWTLEHSYMFDNLSRTSRCAMIGFAWRSTFCHKDTCVLVKREGDHEPERIWMLRHWRYRDWGCQRLHKLSFELNHLSHKYFVRMGPSKFIVYLCLIMLMRAVWLYVWVKELAWKN